MMSALIVAISCELRGTVAGPGSGGQGRLERACAATPAAPRATARKGR